ncbi:cytochrome b5 reductase 4-like [Corticium candelabrum]|uniref:cytochrome b5 reductase 4-like n=1 Tax=Corticium candelabrum TaxID=121492 RepID=UPI002E2611BF|nr:cytochrome b5 reductase 4-like [Corticium candelabrum]
MGNCLSRDDSKTNSYSPVALAVGESKSFNGVQIVPEPVYNWHQTEATTIISLDSNYKELRPEDVVINVSNGVHLTIVVYLGSMLYQLSGEIYATVSEMSVDFIDGRCDVCLTKFEVSHWSALHGGAPLAVKFAPKKKFEMMYCSCAVKEVRQVTHDTKMFLVEFPSLAYVCVPLGHHVFIRHVAEEYEIVRPYSPVVNLEGDRGFEQGRSILLLIKIYPSGSLTRLLAHLAPGDSIEVSRHEGTFTEECFHHTDTLFLIAAGTGLTPMTKLIRRFLEMGESKQVKLLCANKTEEDQIMERELTALQESSHARFEVRHTLSQSSATWSGLKGRVNREMLQEVFNASEGKEIFVCYCGNLPFNIMMRRILRGFKFPEDHCHLFG